jgi:hypothetical protein
MFELGTMTIIIGGTGQGKSFFTKRLVNDKKTFICDLNNEYGAEDLSLASRDNYIKFNEHVTLLDKTKVYPQCRYTGTNVNEFLEISKSMHGRYIVFEEATNFFAGRTNEVTRQMITGKRHRNQSLIFLFHSINAVPPRIMELANYVVLFKSFDEENKVKSKFPQLLNSFKALQQGAKAPIIIDIYNPKNNNKKLF